MTPRPVPDVPSAEDVEDAPRPGAESGRIDRVDPGDGIGRAVGRGLLWFPRVVFEVVSQPLRGATYLQSRYFSGEGPSTEPKRFSVAPVALLQSNAGLHVGVRAYADDLLRRDERLQLYAGLGGELHRVAGVTAELGSRTLSAGIEARLEQRHRERFYGYGNGSLDERPSAPIDPTVNDTAFRTTYRLERRQLVPRVTLRPTKQLALTARVALMQDETSVDDEDPLDEVYTTALGDRDSAYSELSMTWDTRRPAHHLDAQMVHGTGGSASVFGGRSDGALDFYRAGIDLRRNIALTRGPRAVELRFYGETVSGPRAQLPFIELPHLGGRNLLRGYDRDRFRDKVSTAAQVTYLFAVSRFLTASVFVDVGRVYSKLDALTYRDQRVGYGAAIELYSKTAKLFRAEVASSIDGGLFMYVAFNN